MNILFKKQFLYLLIALFLVSGKCNNQKPEKNVRHVDSGFFAWSNDVNHYRELELNPDSNFSYDWRSGYLNGRSIGKWRQEGNKIILHTYIQPSPVSPDITIKKNIDSLSDLNFQFVDLQNSYPIPFIRCILIGENKSYLANSNDQGFVKVPRDIKLRAIEMSDYNYGNFIYTIPENLDANLVQFKIFEDPSFYRHFTNEVWRLDDSTLIPPKQIGPIEEEFRLKQDEQLNLPKFNHK